MNPVLDYLRLATPVQRTKLARLAHTSVANLYQIAGGQRRASSGLAIRLDRASRKLPLPPLDRKQLSKDCAQCEFVRQCKT